MTTRKQQLLTYVDELQKRYDLLADEPFSNKARLALRKELEHTKMIIQDIEMDKCWEALNQLFSCEEPRPRPESADDALLEFSKREGAEILEVDF
jgi:hypothetical protein